MWFGGGGSWRHRSQNISWFTYRNWRQHLCVSCRRKDESTHTARLQDSKPSPRRIHHRFYHYPTTSCWRKVFSYLNHNCLFNIFVHFSDIRKKRTTDGNPLTNRVINRYRWWPIELLLYFFIYCTSNCQKPGRFFVNTQDTINSARERGLQKSLLSCTQALKYYVASV